MQIFNNLAILKKKHILQPYNAIDKIVRWSNKYNCKSIGISRLRIRLKSTCIAFLACSTLCFFVWWKCLISAKNNTNIFKVSTDVNFVTTWIKIKTLVLSST